MKKFYLKALLLAISLLGASSAWAQDDWSTIWYTDFSSAPAGLSYSVTSGSVDISTGILYYHQGGGSGNRAINTAFTDNKFAVTDTNWRLEFDWGASSSNQNASNVVFATNAGAVFTIDWATYASTATVTDANSILLTKELPIDGYNKAEMAMLSHFIITGDKDNGIYLTVTYNGTTYVDNVLVSSTFGYPSTFNGTLGRAASHMALDNIYFKTPAIVGFVAEPTATLIGVNGSARIFTLETLTDDATILWSETAPADDEDYVAWETYDTSLSTEAGTIYAVATDGSNYSEVNTIETGAGEAITLAAPSISIDALKKNGVFYNPVLVANDDQSGTLLQPQTAISATFNGSVVSLPYHATEDGTLLVTVSADGYTSNQTELSVKANYIPSWTSANYSTLTADNVTEVLGETWVLSEGTGRWASWDSSKEPYTYYQEGDASGSNITVEGNLRFRNVVVLNLGYGLSRNVSGSEAVNFLNSSEGTIAEITVYNGYGKDVNDATTYNTYRLDTGDGLASLGCGAGTVLVQVSYYTPAKSVPVTVTEAGWATLYTPYALDFSDVKGLTAYTATVADGVVTLTEVDDVPANTGVVLKGEGEFSIPVIAKATNAEQGDLKGSATEATDVKEDGYYILTKNGDNAQFNPVNKETTIPAGKAYLKVDGAAGANLRVVIAGEATGIAGVEAVAESGVLYNVAGQPVTEAYKGFVIKNGKKYLNK